MKHLERLRPLLPWLSLATGVGGAVLMHRTPERAWVVVAAACAGWILLGVFNVLERRGALKGSELKKRGARFALVVSNQIAVQQALLFPLPFYVRASHFREVPELPHVVFFAVYATALLIALWDPLFARAMQGTASSFLLQAFAVFVGLDMVLPVLGLSNEISLLAAGAATAVGVPLAMMIAGGRTTWGDRAMAVAGGIVIVALVRFAAPAIPPAPLELVDVQIGTHVENKELVGAAPVLTEPEALVCHSSVRAPMGLKDGLVHHWTRNSAQLDDVVLDVRGGRDAGFRTWSRERSAGRGVYTCTVQTALGQVLGTASVVVK